MSSTQQHFAISPSPYLALSISLIHLVVMGVLLQLPLPLFVRALLCFVLLFSWVYYLLSDALLRLGSACIGMKFDVAGVTLECCNSLNLNCFIGCGGVISAGLEVLHVALVGQKKTVYITLLPDSMDAESFRQLRVRLKWSGLLQ